MRAPLVRTLPRLRVPEPVALRPARRRPRKLAPSFQRLAVLGITSSKRSAGIEPAASSVEPRRASPCTSTAQAEKHRTLWV